jgi:hypothetical protein
LFRRAYGDERANLLGTGRQGVFIFLVGGGGKTRVQPPLF